MSPRLITILLLFLAFNTGWFVAYSLQLGVQGFVSVDPSRVSRVFIDGASAANVSLALHMLAGGLLTVAAPLQALPVLRRRWNRLHRGIGYALVALTGVTGLGGLVYIALRGTIGGTWISVWFAIYGLAIMVAGIKTLHHALKGRIQRHFEWATRLVILAVGSWIFRMHYAIWFGLTDGMASNDALTGAFDRVQVVAFFVPYLLIAEFFLRRARGRHEATGRLAG